MIRYLPRKYRNRWFTRIFFFSSFLKIPPDLFICSFHLLIPIFLEYYIRQKKVIDGPCSIFSLKLSVSAFLLLLLYEIYEINTNISIITKLLASYGGILFAI